MDEMDATFCSKTEVTCADRSPLRPIILVYVLKRVQKNHFVGLWLHWAWGCCCAYCKFSLKFWALAASVLPLASSEPPQCSLLGKKLDTSFYTKISVSVSSASVLNAIGENVCVNTLSGLCLCLQCELTSVFCLKKIEVTRLCCYMPLWQPNRTTASNFSPPYLLWEMLSI